MPRSIRDMANNWAKNLGAAGERIRQGVQSVTVSPTEKAAAAVDRQVSGVIQAANSGKTAAALRRVSNQDWQKAMMEKGIPRIASGASSSVSKVEQFLGELMPHVEAGKRSLESMPRGDKETNRARMNAWMDHMSGFRRNR